MFSDHSLNNVYIYSKFTVAAGDSFHDKLKIYNIYIASPIFFVFL